MNDLGPRPIRVVLVFRSPQRGGQSIEALFQPFIGVGQPGFEIQAWYYDSQKTLWQNISALRSLQADVWHVTGDINPISLLLPASRVLVTVHDIGRFKELRGWRKWLYGKLWVEWPIRRAACTVAVSAYTRDDIRRYFPALRSPPIQIIHNGIQPELHPQSNMRDSENPVVIQIGTATHKNLDTLIKALPGLGCKLVVIGGLSSRQRKALDSGSFKYEVHEGLNRGRLWEELSKADLLVFASLHEGFGMPVVEAQLIGCPVIVSRMASLPEIAGEGAHYLEDPLDPQELREAIRLILGDEGYRRYLVGAGKKNASRFDFGRMFREYADIYSRLTSA